MLSGLKLTTIVLISLPFSLVIIILGLADPHGKGVYHIFRFWCCVSLWIVGVRLKVRHCGALDRTRVYVFVANHQSMIDIPVLVHALPEFQLRWIAKKELLLVPFLGWAMWASKHLTVDRSKISDAKQILEKAQAKLANKVSVVVFPEGTRSPDGRLLPFKRGGFLLAQRADAPVVPVTIKGSAAVLPKGDWRLRKGEVEVIVGQEVRPDPASDPRQLLQHVRNVIAKGLEEQAGRDRRAVEPTPLNALEITSPRLQ